MYPPRLRRRRPLRPGYGGPRNRRKSATLFNAARGRSMRPRSVQLLTSPFERASRFPQGRSTSADERSNGPGTRSGMVLVHRGGRARKSRACRRCSGPTSGSGGMPAPGRRHWRERGESLLQPRGPRRLRRGLHRPPRPVRHRADLTCPRSISTSASSSPPRSDRCPPPIDNPSNSGTVPPVPSASRTDHWRRHEHSHPSCLVGN